jgi:acyl-CoA dehydrogenase
MSTATNINADNLRADDLLIETVSALFADQCTPERTHAAEGSLDSALWTMLEDGGLTLVGVGEGSGGSGGTFADAMAIVKASGEFAAAVPIADTLTSAMLIARAGLPIPAGPLALAVIDHDRLSAVRVPWGQVAHNIAVATPTGLTVIAREAVIETGRGENYAGEGWLQIDVRGLAAGTDASVAVTATDAKALGALARATQMGGALGRVVDLCVQYANEREQFGKPIGKFQVLQHYLSEIAGEAVTSVAAAENAADVIAFGADRAEVDQVVGAAKAVAGRAAGTVNRLAHQIHGAIGYTDEHRLQYWTRRLWAWRDEFGTESEWAALLGASLAAAGGAALWPRVTTWPRPM